MNDKKVKNKIGAIRKIFALAVSLAVLSATALLVSGCNKKNETAEDGSELYAEYDIHVAVERDFKRIYVTEKVNVTNLSDDAIEKLEFDMFAFAYESGADPSAYFKSEQSKWEKGETLIGGVSANGLPAEVERAGVCMRVTLPRALGADESVEIGIAFTSATPTSPLRYGREGDALKLTDFYPVLRTCSAASESEEYSLIAHPSRTSVSIYNMSYSISKNVAIATNQPIKSIQENGETVIVECEKSNLREAGAVVWSDSKEIRRSSSGRLLSDSDALLGYAESAYTAFYSLTGEFPFDVLSVVAVPINEDFVAISGLVLINEKLSGDRLKNAVLNGVAAQYFGCAAGTAADTDRWAGEGTAYYLGEYFSILTGDEETYTTATANDSRLTASMTEEMSEYYPGYALHPARSISEYLTVNEYETTVRCGTALIYDRLRKEYGDKKLRKAIVRLYDYAKFGRITSDEAAEVLSSELGRGAGDIIRSML